MTMSNLSLVLFACAVTLFVTSQFAKRAKEGNPKLESFRKVLTVVTLGLAAVYFYKRFVG